MSDHLRIDEILHDVRRERGEQITKWGNQSHIHFKWMAILSEEVGEAAQEILHGHRSRLRRELIQVAAVAVAWIEQLDSECTLWDGERK